MSSENSKRTHKKDTDILQTRIDELKRENAQLRGEIALLKSELQQSKASTRRLNKKRDMTSSLLLHQARRENTFSQRSTFSYFTHALKNASLFRLYSQIVNTVKRFTFVTTTIQVLLVVLTVVKSGVIVLISTSAFIVSLPFLFLMSGLGAILTFIGSKKATKQNTPIIKGKRVCVFFPAKKSVMRKGGYFAGFVRSIAEEPNTVCIIVTPGFFFSRGISEGKHYFFTSRIDAQNIIIVRRHYYFKLKKKIIEPLAAHLTEIY